MIIVLHKGKVARSERLKNGLVVDYNRLGRPLSIEVLNARKRLAEGTITISQALIEQSVLGVEAA